MSYTIYKSDGTVQTTINDGFLDTSTSLKLPGPNYVGYGRYLNENLLYLLENFAANTAPVGTSTEGQLWFDKFNKILKVFTSDAGYVPVSGVTNSGTQPISAKDGDLWFNTVTNQIYLYNNGNWEFIGPQYTRAQGVSGIIPVTVNDGSSSSITHNILKLQFGNLTIATLSSDAPFLPSPPIDGFGTINPGITLNSNISSRGTNLNSNLQGNVAGAVLGDVYTKNGVTRVLSVGTNLTNSIYYGDIYANVGIKVLDNGTDGTDAYFIGSVTGNVTGNLTSTNSNIDNLVAGNLTTANATITGASSTVKGIAEVTAQSGYFSNLSSGNILVSGGTMNVATIAANQLTATNIRTGNAVITGGYINNLANITSGNASIVQSVATTSVATNFSSGNVAITGGYIKSVSNIYATLGTIDNFGSSNIIVTGGRVSGLTSLSATTIDTPTLTATGANISNANIASLTLTGGNLSGVSLTQTVATTQPYYDSTANVATTAFVQSVVPRGVIWMWNSTAASIPTGWQLCNGSNGTPDLRDRFIVGAGASYTPGTTGGNNTVTLSSTQMPPHIHPISIVTSTGSAGGHTHTVSDPGHSHSYVKSQNAYDQVPSPLAPAYGYTAWSTTTTTTGSSATGVSLAAAANHTHTINISDTTGSQGDGQPHENRPPYYALCYIQKMY